MKIYIKNKGHNKLEVWVEDFIKDDFEVVCEAEVILMGDTALIDEIETKPEHRKRGYASAIINKLKCIYKNVQPIGILTRSESFWEKHGMSDALGKEI